MSVKTGIKVLNSSPFQFGLFCSTFEEHGSRAHKDLRSLMEEISI